MEAAEAGAAEAAEVGVGTGEAVAPSRVLVLFKNEGPDAFDAPPGVLRVAVSKFA